MPVVAFLIYASVNGSIGPAEIFPALALFQGLFQPILTVPQAITSVTVAQVSWRRISDLLNADEAQVISDENPISPNDISLSGKTSLEVKSATFKWGKLESKSPPLQPKKGWGRKKEEELSVEEEKEQIAFGIEDISFSITTGQKVAIVGAVGSGKSSLLSALIGEMPRLSGDESVNGTVAYCAQQPFILTETIQGNIVFNQELDEDRLHAVLEVCSLDVDLIQFPGGVMTEITQFETSAGSEFEAEQLGLFFEEVQKRDC